MDEVRTKQQKSQAKCWVRYMVRTEIPDVGELEKECFTKPWDVEKIYRKSFSKDIHSFVAEVDRLIVGWGVCRIHKDRITLLRLAVALLHRDCGIGSQLLLKMTRGLAMGKRIVAAVPEDSLGSQLFLQAHGFKATKILKAESGEVRYMMEK